MRWIAIKMLLGNRGKYLGALIGVSVAALLISHQSSIFCGLMLQTASQIRDVQDAEIWIMDPSVHFVDDLKRLADRELYRPRGVEGVEWAVRLFKGMTEGRLRDGSVHQVMLLGIDDTTLVGGPGEILVGSLDDLRRPDAILVDEVGYGKLWPGEPLVAGRTLEMNDRRAVVVGVCRSSPTFQSVPVLYTRYSEAASYVPTRRRVISYMLAKSAPDVSVAEACRRIEAQTGLRALPKQEFVWVTMRWYLRNTGILANFSVTVLLGMLVGSAIAGQTFYMFTVENLSQFGSLRAMGASRRGVVRMILLQAAVIGLLGYGIGVGLTALFGEMIRGNSRLTFYMPWQVLLITACGVLLIIGASSLVSIRRALVHEPALVLRG